MQQGQSQGSVPPPARRLLAGYDPGGYFCELTSRAGQDGASAAALRQRLDSMDLAFLRHRTHDVELDLFNSGITFTLYQKDQALDRILPFDVIPRLLTAADWAILERGIQQRVAAMNLFLADIYHDGRILKDGLLPAGLVERNAYYRDVMRGFDVPCGTYVHVDGTDLVRGPDGQFLVLEDNARTPSGVSYVVENRNLIQRAFPDLINDIGVRPVFNYGEKLLEALCQVAPPGILDPQVVLLSPGTYNSAYFEHVFLAREMGVPLVEGRDLTVRDNDVVYMKTIDGLERVDVIYRRIDDDFLDPEAFRPDSALGVPGLVRAYLRGRVTLANAIGTGVADDKAIYAYMPRIIQYYLGEEPILRNVETHVCAEPEGLAYTLANLAELVVKPVGGSGGYGITIGPRATRDELEVCAAQLRADPRNYISQPVVGLSVSPTLAEDGVEPRHVDLRPFAVTGRSTWVLPGGLTRVALRRGSLVVNSSQGGGSKDTWVLDT